MSARILLAVVVLASACRVESRATLDSAQARDSVRLADSAFAAVQSRGKAVMGVDQYTSSHVFEDLPDGGRIALDRQDAADAAGIAEIRRHMQSVADDFRKGDFAKPFAVHAQVVPGTAVMAARHDVITYAVVDRPRGAEVRITTREAAVVAAVHAFLAFQRTDHRAPGHEGHAGHQM